MHSMLLIRKEIQKNVGASETLTTVKPNSNDFLPDKRIEQVAAANGFKINMCNEEAYELKQIKSCQLQHAMRRNCESEDCVRLINPRDRSNGTTKNITNDPLLINITTFQFSFSFHLHQHSILHAQNLGDMCYLKGNNW